MWREIVKAVLPGARLAKASSAAAIARLETSLKVSVPLELRQLLRETNGVRTGNGIDLVWGVGAMVANNQTFREPGQFEDLYQSFADLLFFGQDANGDQFAYQLARKTKRPPIVRWDHETDDRSQLAASLEAFFRLLGSTHGQDEPAGQEAPALERPVSIWIGNHDSRAAFESYLAPGGSGRVSADGLPLSAFQSEFGLLLRDLLKCEQHSVYATGGQTIAALIRDFPGCRGIEQTVTRATKRLGRDRVTSMVLLFGLRYAPGAPTPVTPRAMTFVGFYEAE